MTGLKCCQPKPPKIKSFPPRRVFEPDDAGDDYAAKSHKRKRDKRFSAGGSGTPDSYADASAVWRRGAKKVSYNEAAMYDDLSASGSEGEVVTPVNTEGEDEIDLVLSHARDEEHLQDPKDIPQLNLVSIPSVALTVALPY